MLKGNFSKSYDVLSRLPVARGKLNYEGDELTTGLVLIRVVLEYLTT